jgi:predicted Zn-dependent protease
MVDDAEKEQREAEDAALATASGELGRDKLEVELLEQRIRSLRHEVDRLSEQRPLLLAALRYQHIGDIVKIALQVMAGIVAAMVVVALSAAMWSAAHDNSLVIEAFATPPDMAARGLTGQVIASQVLDRLATLQNRTPTARAASTYSDNWGRDDIKVEIPQTGISIGDLNHYLREWLGHETHITGEVYRTDAGISVTARVGGDAGAVFEGPQSDLSKLLQQAADDIYGRTQPYRYAVYLVEHGQAAQSDAVLRSLLANGPASEAKWAHLGLASSLANRTRYRDAVNEANEALMGSSDFGMAYNLLALNQSRLGHEEAALAALHAGLPALVPGRDPQVTARAAKIMHAMMDAQLDAALGNFRDATTKYAAAAELPDYDGLAGLARIKRVEALALDHDGNAIAEMQTLGKPQTIVQLSEYAATIQLIPTALGQWVTAAFKAAGVINTIIADMHDLKNPLYQTATMEALTAAIPCRLLPMSAVAFARVGLVKKAVLYVAVTPPDCYLALRARAQVAAAEGRAKGAEYWFATAVAKAPSIPFAYSEWGEVLLAEGNPDAAMAKFELAHDKGPYFADPLELWGEALMAKNRSDLALAKFAEADRYAPDWGRLHLKWGEALLYAERKREAKMQLAAATRLNLSTAEKTELARADSAHG